MIRGMNEACRADKGRTSKHLLAYRVSIPYPFTPYANIGNRIKKQTNPYSPRKKMQSTLALPLIFLHRDQQRRLLALVQVTAQHGVIFALVQVLHPFDQG